MQRVHIIGRKNSGKTTLMVDLVRHYSSQGLRVGTIKHTHHRHELDVPGKDSYLHRQAGASAVGILSPGMNAVFWPAGGGPIVEPHQDRYASFAALMADCQLVLVEGDSGTSALKVEVWRPETQATPLALTDSAIRALITDAASDVTCEIWPRRDLPEVARRIWRLASGT